MMMLGPLSRVVILWKNMQNSHFFKWTERYSDPTEPHKDLTVPQVLRNYATAVVQKLQHRRSSETMAPHTGFTEPCRTKFCTQKVWSLHVFAQNGCLTNITLLRGPKLSSKAMSCVKCTIPLNHCRSYGEISTIVFWKLFSVKTAV